VHEGVFENNVFHGPGKITLTGGCDIKGDFSHGNLVHGTITNAELLNGGTYTGQVTGKPSEVDGRFGFVQNGTGKKTLANGIVEEGIFVDDFIHKGKVTFPDPEGLGFEVHEGVFVNGCLNGHGKVTAATFSEEGNFVGGELNGPGILTYADGGVLKGTFVDGYIHSGTAENVKCLTSDDIYTGTIVDGQPTVSRTTNTPL